MSYVALEYQTMKNPIIPYHDLEAKVLIFLKEPENVGICDSMKPEHTALGKQERRGLPFSRKVKFKTKQTNANKTSARMT